MSAWIEWKGGECPVDSETIVSVKFRSLYDVESPPYKASGLGWGRTGWGTDIVAYRVIEPAAAPAPDPRLAAAEAMAEVLKFYADTATYRSSSTGFALQYDPAPQPIETDKGAKAAAALAAWEALK